MHVLKRPVYITLHSISRLERNFEDIIKYKEAEIGKKYDMFIRGIIYSTRSMS